MPKELHCVNRRAQQKGAHHGAAAFKSKAAVVPDAQAREREKTSAGRARGTINLIEDSVACSAAAASVVGSTPDDVVEKVATQEASKPPPASSSVSPG